MIGVRSTFALEGLSTGFEVRVSLPPRRFAYQRYESLVNPELIDLEGKSLSALPPELATNGGNWTNGGC